MVCLSDVHQWEWLTRDLMVDSYDNLPKIMIIKGEIYNGQTGAGLITTLDLKKQFYAQPMVMIVSFYFQNIITQFSAC